MWGGYSDGGSTKEYDNYVAELHQLARELEVVTYLELREMRGQANEVAVEALRKLRDQAQKDRDDDEK